MLKHLRALAAASLLAGLVAGCGIRGDLTPAAPMWGDARGGQEDVQEDAHSAPASAESSAPADEEKSDDAVEPDASAPQ